MARKVKKRLPATVKNRLNGLADGVEGLLDELEQGGTRTVVAPYAREFIGALRQHVAGRSLALDRMLGNVQPKAGAPGFEKATKLDLLRQFRKLRSRGVTHEDSAAALRVGKKPVSIDQRTVSKWKSQGVGIAEEIEARLNAQDEQKGT